MSRGGVVAELPLRGVVGRMRAAVTGRHLGSLGRRHLAEGLPQLATFAFDHVGQAIAVWGRYERDELELLMRSLGDRRAERGVCLDVGANIGNHSLFFADHFEEVFAFEPHPRTFALLRLNAELKGNVRCFNVAASDAEGRARLAQRADNVGMASLHGDPAGGSVECRLCRIDDLPELTGRPVALMKVDVEGHEAAVLRGARAMLMRERPVVVFEQAAAEIRDGTSESIELLRECGYATFWTVEHHPAGRFRFLNLARRLVAGEGLRMVARQRFESRFHSMIVALADRAG